MLLSNAHAAISAAANNPTRDSAANRAFVANWTKAPAAAVGNVDDHGQPAAQPPESGDKQRRRRRRQASAQR
jgi:hypothetical protein